jgi:hypothetical protein
MKWMGKLAGGIVAFATLAVLMAPPAAATTGSQIDNATIDRFFVAESVSVSPTTGLHDESPALEFAGTWSSPQPGVLFVSEITRDEETGEVIAHRAPKHFEGGVDSDELVTLKSGAAVVAVIPAATPYSRSSVVARVTNVQSTTEYEIDLVVGDKAFMLVDTQLPSKPLRTATAY